MAPRVRKGNTSNGPRVTAMRSLKALVHRPSVVGFLLTVALLAALSLPSHAFTPASLKQPSVAKQAAPLQVPAGHRLAPMSGNLPQPALSHAAIRTAPSPARMSALHRGNRRVSFTLSAGHGGQELTRLTVRLPPRMALPHSGKRLEKRIYVRAAGERLKLTAWLHHRTLTIRLKSPVSSVHVTIVGRHRLRPVGKP